MIDPSLRRRKPLSRFPKRRPQIRIGKLGIVRLHGKAKARLRLQCFERGTIDTDGVRHSAKVAWRALAMLQLEIESSARAHQSEEEK